MTTRDQLLARVRQNKPEPLPLPNVPTFVSETDDLFTRFCDALAFVGGQLVELPGDRSAGAASQPHDSLSDYIRQSFPNTQRIASSVPLLNLTLTTVGPETDKHLLEQIDVAVLRGAFAVAENAAVWVPEANMLHRALPFIAQHLVLVVSRGTLVPNMHVAYQRIHPERAGGAFPGYGTFIAGPSKTADIEQSLVIGAHGARSLTLVLTDDAPEPPAG